MSERPIGALIDPEGTESIAINQSQFESLKTVLRVLENDDDDLAYAVLHHLLLGANLPHTERARRTSDEWDVIGGFLNWADRGEGAEGILLDMRAPASRPGAPAFIRLHDDEFEVLQNTMTAMRRGGWMEGWLPSLVYRVAVGRDPDRRYPTPLEVMQTLTEPASEFETEIRAATVYARNRPDLLFPPPPAEPETAPEPGAATDTRKPQRARKGRRKAA